MRRASTFDDDLVAKLTFRLYCSSECRTQDRGSASPATKAIGIAYARFTTQLPATLSLRHRPHQVDPSSGKPAHVPSRRVESFSSSSTTASQIQSARTCPWSGLDSHQKEPLDLIPQAFRAKRISLGYVDSIPVMIPRLSVKRTPTTTSLAAHTPGSHGGNLYPLVSIDTLRFGRKPGVVDSVTIPNPQSASGPCVCGKSVEFPDSSEKTESGLASLPLNPSFVAPHMQHSSVTSSSAHISSYSGQKLPHQDRDLPTSKTNHTISFAHSTSTLSRSRAAKISHRALDSRMSLVTPTTQPDKSGSIIAPIKDQVTAQSPGQTCLTQAEHNPVQSVRVRGRTLERQPPHLKLAQASVAEWK